ncbi:MAG: alpha/beta hydrolase [Proteobacteria bacterium]|nr:alpha/beta hydrolase [Burkholderiales bacterium]
MKPSRSRYLAVHGLGMHVREWGEPGAPMLFLLHGWMDVSASFQFLVDAFERDWHVVAPDWRGFGLSDWAAHGYEFPDYFADLDALLDRLSPETPASIVGHSMGGNVLMSYAGVRPMRVARVVSLEGFGGHRHPPERAPEHLAAWLAQQRAPVSFRPYPSLAEVARRLRMNNPRLSDTQAAFLAPQWARPAAHEGFVLRADPRHKQLHAQQTRLDEVFACWLQIACPVLWIMGSDPANQGFRLDTPAQFAQRRAQVPDLRVETLGECGHMLHHDQPRAVARLIEAFVS